MKAPHLAQEALGLYRRGDFKNAERAARKALAAVPGDPDLLQLLASTLVAQGRAAEAVALLERVIATGFASGDALYNLGTALAMAGRHKEATQRLKQASIARPRDPDCHNNLGIALLHTHQYGDAEAAFAHALRLRPDWPYALYHRGRARAAQGRHQDALNDYSRARGNSKSAPAELMVGMGSSLHDLGRPAEALASFDQALALNPKSPEGHNGRANALNMLRRPEEALASYECALTLKPDFAEAHSGRGDALNVLDRPAEALASYDRALALDPNLPVAWSGRGNALLLLKRPVEALAAFDRALALNPGSPEAHNGRGAALILLKRSSEALVSLDRSVAVNPDNAEAHYNRGLALMDLKRLNEALASLARALSLNPEHFNAWVYYGTSARCICDWREAERAEAEIVSACRLGSLRGPSFYILAISDDPAMQQAAAQNYVRAYASSSSLPLAARTSANPGKLRIGYLSSDFRQHPVATLIVELIELHDRSRFEVIGFSAGRDDKSAIRQRIRDAFDVFVDAQDMSDIELQTAIQEAQIDIIVDLGGHTADGRILALAGRAAPVQVTYLGYPGTVGTQFIDYAIVDKFVVPDSAAAFFTEKLAYLPHCYLVSDRKRPTVEHIPSRAERDLPSDAFVFCCFNGPYKITPVVFDHWMRILIAVPGSVLWLLGDNPSAQDNLRQEAQKRGVDPTRLVFMPRLSYAEHLAALRLADLFLDTWHYNAHTTASDALWVGLPVLTCSGRTFAARVAGSLLHAIGMPELVTYSPDDYEALAVKLAREPDVLGELRQRLAANIDTAPLFQTDLFTRHIEAAFQQMWERQGRGEKPETFEVASLQ